MEVVVVALLGLPCLALADNCTDREAMMAKAITVNKTEDKDEISVSNLYVLRKSKNMKISIVVNTINGTSHEALYNPKPECYAEDNLQRQSVTVKMNTTTNTVTIVFNGGSCTIKNISSQLQSFEVKAHESYMIRSGNPQSNCSIKIEMPRDCTLPTGIPCNRTNPVQPTSTQQSSTNTTTTSLTHLPDSNIQPSTLIIIASSTAAGGLALVVVVVVAVFVLCRKKSQRSRDTTTPPPAQPEEPYVTYNDLYEPLDEYVSTANLPENNEPHVTVNDLYEPCGKYASSSYLPENQYNDMYESLDKYASTGNLQGNQKPQVTVNNRYKPFDRHQGMSTLPIHSH